MKSYEFKLGRLVIGLTGYFDEDKVSNRRLWFDIGFRADNHKNFTRFFGNKSFLFSFEVGCRIWLYEGSFYIDWSEK